MLSREEFKEWMSNWRTSAWRWECQGVYREPSEDEPLRQFLAGEPDLGWFQGWLTRVRTWTAAGQRIGRVRMVTDPLTDYLRFELSITPPAIEAGEDIRFLSSARAAELGAPDEDFWLFDEEVVLALRFGEHGVSGAELITDPGKVSAYRAWRDKANAAAVLFTDLHLTT
ncbi:MAG TPA: hypothetical protein VHX38_04525 [Pseudonocardiaceae bacterium]|nr:hypothetical protein [Pseudonocardiaceae bacterium]